MRAFGGEAHSDFFGSTGQEWLDHGHIVDYDGDEGFADCPAAGLLRAVGSSLCGWKKVVSLALLRALLGRYSQ